MVTPPENAVVSLIWIALKFAAVTVPVLVMPPAKLEMPSTAMPSCVALIVPPLVTPPEYVGTETSMPNPAEMVPILSIGPEKLPLIPRVIPPKLFPAVIVPVFVIPPVAIASPIEMPENRAVIEPLLRIVPLMVELAIKIPEPLGEPAPFALMMPVRVLVTLPAIVALLMNMQVMATEFVTGPLLPFTFTQAAASAVLMSGGLNSAAPVKAETSEVVAKRPARTFRARRGSSEPAAANPFVSDRKIAPHSQGRS
ncbi:MAG: hypothetical protein WCA56_20220 [Xanthobacteraceae bacterium]